MAPVAICYTWKKYDKHAIPYIVQPFHLIAKIFLKKKTKLQGG